MTDPRPPWYLQPKNFSTYAELDASEEQARAYAAAGLTPLDVARSYLSKRTRYGIAIVRPPQNLRLYVSAGISPDLAAEYDESGIDLPENVAELHRWGCPPAVVRAYRAAQAPSGHRWQDWSGVEFAANYEDLRVGCRRLSAGDLDADYAPIINATVATGSFPTPEQVLAWLRTGLPVDRITLLVAAGVTPEEATAPAIVGADIEALRTMAALRQGRGAES